MTESWVVALAKKLECPVEALKSLALHRKAFDNYLMLIGRLKAEERIAQRSLKLKPSKRNPG